LWFAVLELNAHGRQTTTWPLPEGEGKMPRLALPDPTRTGRHAEDLESRLVVGQDEAIHQIVRAYQTHLAGLAPVGRPIGNFLFLGPTGSGKTRIVEATAEALLKDSRSVIKIDCAEFQHSHEIAKLIGSPPGYLGHRETHALLSKEALNQHHTEEVNLSFVLFDEIEKASDALWNPLLGILDKTTLTLGDNRKVDFASAMIFLTSNLGAAEMSSLLSPRPGFHVVPLEDPRCNAQLSARISGAGIAAARRKFTPEFINRLDKIVVFKSLRAEELRRIVDIVLEIVQQRIQTAADSKPFFLKTALDTDYESCEVHLDDRRVYSVSRTTRIQEIEEYGAPAQRILHEGEGNGIIWRLFWITRHVECHGGVYLELEAIGLSRDIPASLRWLVEPIVRRVSRGSLSTSLRQTENAVRIRAELANRKTGNGGSIVPTAHGGPATHDLQAAHSSR
jgi:AAA domain (Cdc48 subfamily)